MVALDIEGVSLPTVCGLTGIYRAVLITVGVDSLTADISFFGGVGRDTFDGDVLAVAARKHQRCARTVNTIGINVDGKSVGLVLFNGD